MAVGGFEEALITDEDYDLGIRLNAAGFTLLESPAVAVVHLGNPRSLLQFFRKIRWHATGGMRLLANRKLDKPMLMTYAFAISCTMAMILIFLFPANLLSWLISISLVLSVPVASSLYRLVQFRNYRYFPHLVILFAVYYCARCKTFGVLIVKKR